MTEKEQSHTSLPRRIARTIYRTAILPLIRTPIRALYRNSVAFPGRTFAWKHFVVRYISGRHYEATVQTRFGASMRVQLPDFISERIYFFGSWEPHHTGYIASRLKPGDYFVDVGANIGYYALLGARLVGSEGRVIALEPSDRIFKELTHNVAINRCSNVDLHKVAAAAEPSSLTMYEDPDEQLCKTTVMPRPGWNPAGVADAVPLWSLLAKLPLHRIRVIKIDVEGAEMDVLSGLVPLLGQLSEDVDIIVEITPEWLVERGDTAAKMFRILQGHGFSGFVLPEDYSLEHYLNPPVSVRVTAVNPDFSGPRDVVFTRRNLDTAPIRIAPDVHLAAAT